MKNWTKTKIEEICSEISSGGTPKTENSAFWSGSIPWISGTDIANQKVSLIRKYITTEAVKKSNTRLCPKDSIILVSRVGVGKVAIAPFEIAVSQDITNLVLKKEVTLPDFMFFALQNSISQLLKFNQGTSISGITQGILRNLEIYLPPLGEQKKIAEILSTWDKAVETTEKFVAAKQKLKKSLMQRLFTGSQRFPAFHGQEQKHKYLGEVAFESTERNKNLMTSEKLMAVMKSAGMIPMRERVQSENVSRCKIVAPKWFAYNPMRLNIGSIAQWNGNETVMVSGDYVVFKCNESLLNPDYLNHFRKSYGWTNFVKNSGDGSVRIRIYFSHLADLKILLPPLEEQKKIAAVLNNCDAEINVLQNKLNAIRRQKRGLMQKLLTGKVRVKIN